LALKIEAIDKNYLGKAIPGARGLAEVGMGMPASIQIISPITAERMDARPAAERPRYLLPAMGACNFLGGGM